MFYWTNLQRVLKAKWMDLKLFSPEPVSRAQWPAPLSGGMWPEPRAPGLSTQRGPNNPETGPRWRPPSPPAGRPSTSWGLNLVWTTTWCVHIDHHN